MSHSEEQRMKAVALREAGFSIRDIADKLKTGKKFVQNWVKFYKTSGGVKRKPGTGARTKKTPNVKRFLMANMKNKRGASLRKTSRKLESKKGIKISHSSVQRYAKSENLQPFHRRRRPLLTAEQMEARVTFANLRMKFAWKQCIFSDESSFELYPRGNPKNDVVWATTSEDVPINPQVTRSPSVMVWGGISIYGKTKLHIFNSSENAEVYGKVLKKCLLPCSRQWFSRQRWTFVHDRASPHQALEKKGWFRDNNVCPLMIPPKSPDMNIIEKVWAVMKANVQASTPRTVDSLKRAIKKEWAAISDDFIQSLFAKIPKNLRTIIATGGKIVDK